ncbi:MAG: DUF2325 domain-containing protein [Burkholderiaceae bacterium]
MTIHDDQELLLREHRALLRAHGRAQAGCSDLLMAQACEIERLQAQAMRLRAAVIARETALAWAREDRAELERSIPGLPRRTALSRQVSALLARLQDLMRERLQPDRPAERTEAMALTTATAADRPAGEIDTEPDSVDELEASLRAADLVICQTGCLSHGAYWRVQDHCRRTGKTCVLIDRPDDALRIVRIHAARDESEGEPARADAGTTQDPA